LHLLPSVSHGGNSQPPSSKDITGIPAQTKGSEVNIDSEHIDRYKKIIFQCLKASKAVHEWMACESKLYSNCLDETDYTGVAKKGCGVLTESALSGVFDQLSAKAIQKEPSFGDYLTSSGLDYRAYSYEVCMWPYSALTGGTDRSVLASECSLRVLAERLYELNEAVEYLMER
jgi:hypothetical protein